MTDKTDRLNRQLKLGLNLCAKLQKMTDRASELALESIRCHMTELQAELEVLESTERENDS